MSGYVFRDPALGPRNFAAPEDREPVLKGQLDLFAHSQSTILQNDLTDAVLERDRARVHQLLERLRALAPGHPALPAFGTLRAALEAWPASTRACAADAHAAARAVEWLDSAVAPAAAGALGAAAAAFMRSLWHELGVAVAARPYDPAHPRAHFAYCHLRAGDARAALQGLTTIAGYELDPFVLQWLILAQHAVSGWHACRSGFFTLALTAPQHLPAILEMLGDASVEADWERFWTDCLWLDQRDERAGAWFPAWYLIEHPATRPGQVPGAESSEAACARAFRAMRELLALERAGYGAPLVAARAQLRQIDTRLFEHYMSRRAGPAAAP